MIGWWRYKQTTPDQYRDGGEIINVIRAMTVCMIVRMRRKAVAIVAIVTHIFVK